MVFVEAFAAVRELGLPTVAAVEGFALGGGYELALSCDLVVAADTATLGLPEVSLGLVPGGGGTQLLSRRVGRNRALDLVLTGRRVGAAEAYELGLVDRLVPAGTARAAARDLAVAIARHSPVSLRAAKRAVRDGFEADLATGLTPGGPGLARGRLLARPARGDRGVQRQAVAAVAVLGGGPG